MMCNQPNSEQLYQLINQYLGSPEPHDLITYRDKKALSTTHPEHRLAAALCVLVTLWDDTELDVTWSQGDWLEVLLGRLNQSINQQLDAILHHSDFQALESIWRSIDFLLNKTENNSAVKIEVLNVSKDDLHQDFAAARDLNESGLYHHLYHMEYDMPGGDPVTALISDYSFNEKPYDISLLRNIATVSASTHCPFLANVGPQFFQKSCFDEVLKIPNLKTYFERAEYVDWLAFRQLEAARYIGLLLPKFLLRLPYGQAHPVPGFHYEESTNPIEESGWLWGAASFAFAANMVRSFIDNGWLINVRGPESGGKVMDLPLPKFTMGNGLFCKPPTEVLIAESKELQFADMGFIPLCYYKNSNYACFFSANSVQNPVLYTNHAHTANSRVNARLPYVFLVSRLGHYLKVLQREVIGSEKSAAELQLDLNAWLQGLVTKMHDPAPEMAVRYPLREATVNVAELAANPGYFKVDLWVVPHFQVEGVDIRLSLVSKLPASSGSLQ